MTRFKMFAFLAIPIVALASYFLSTFPLLKQSEAAQSLVPKYIFIFLADGAGIPHMEIARMYSRHIHKEGLIIPDKIMKEGSVGFLTTHAADSLTTDSAAAATAMACGCKAKIGMIGMCEDGTVSKTVMEVAKEKGLRIGLVTTSTIYDASPGAFASHVPSRNLYGPIIDQYLDLGVDLLLGGGRDQFLPNSQKGSRRKDDTDMLAVFKKQGYAYVSNKKELAGIKEPRVLGLFSLGQMNFELDRDKNTEPSVYDMTEATIRVLQKEKRGFVVFIESQHIDTAAHLTDVASLIREFREFDRAVGLAYEFYKKHQFETLVLITADHETGGLGFTRALRDLTSTRRSNQLDATAEDLRKIQSIPISLKKAKEILGPNPTEEAVDRLMKDYFKGFVLAPEFKNAILSKNPLGRTLYVDPIAHALGMMIANNTQAYWMTSSHTNHPVFVAALGVGAERFRGYQDNTDFAKHLLALLEGRRPLKKSTQG